MDEDLKIVLTSELEADEQASAQRISAQLPNIAKLINSKSTIKVGVTLDSSNIQSETQKISRQITQATKTHAVGVTLNLNQSSVSKIQQELNNLKVSPDISRAMTEQLDKMGIQIDRITGRWQAVNGEEERMLNLTIQGTDQMQRTVTYLQTYDAETGEINTHLTNVTANLEKQRSVQEQLARRAKADNESRVSYLTKQQAIIADIQATYAGATSAKPVTNDSHLTELNNTYSAINAQIQTMISSEGKLDSVQRANLEAQIAGLKRMVKEYQNAEYVATKLRTKDIGAIKSDQLSGLEALEKRLEAAGTLTDTFKQKIDGLKTSLNGVNNKDQLVSFLNSFDQLNNDVSVFQERLRGVNNIYTQLISLDKQITSVQNQMVKLDPQSDQNKLVALQGQLAVLQNQRVALEGQLVPYADIVQYAKQATALEQSRLLNGSQLVYTQMEIADRAREYDIAMQRIPATIADLQTKYNQLVQPTEVVTQNMRQLRELASQYSSDKSDAEKVQIYERLHQLIGACSKEMSELLRVQRGDIGNFKFTQGLEKAKADLETIRRTWSAFKSDPGLNAQFQQLEANLKRVNNQADLTKWTAQFSTFKSEVKAAGKNMQSLGDILKNNVGKVLQWVSATTLLFRAFRLLRSALSTIVDLDTAMVDLRKVTVATEAEYRSFYATANDTAKALGVTTEAVISQTAEWVRLGYTMSEAAELAKNSAIFAAISPGMDITQATDGLVSALKAFDEIDVEDSLDGIISKVNDIGNKFAVSNKDIVEVMTRSSSAMKAANNTFEETVALATAAVEITRDSASVGNALKTVSMRIRGYDEELEEYSADVAMLTGDIADLTKVASNNNRGVSLFEAGDPDTYRSTYDILQDIAEIWDELTDKNQAQLLEALFGKRQGQIGAAILSNFEQAQKVIETMENSAGSADREMEKIKNSLEYKLNALKETWVGVAQNLFQTDDLKVVVDALTAISGAIDTLTEHLGLFGSVGLITAISLVFKFKSAMGSLQTTVLPVVNAIKASGVAMDGSAASVQFYATKLMGLDKSQQAAAMSALGLNAEQRKQVTTMTALITSAQKYTIQELAAKASTDKATAATLAKNMAKATEKRTTEQLTAAMMVEILNSNKLTAAQKQMIIASLEQTAANETQAFSWKVVGANAKAALAAMATNPMTWIMLAVSGIMLLVQAWQKTKQAAEEARSAMNEAADAANERRNSLADLIKEYRELAKAGDFDSSARETAKRIQEDITNLVGSQADNLDLVNGKLDDQIAKLNDIKLQNAYDVNDALDTKYRDAQSQYNAGIDASGSGTNILGVVLDEGAIDQILQKIGYVNEAWENVNGQISFGYVLQQKNAEEVLDVYKELQHVLLNNNDWQDMADSWLGSSSQDILNGIQKQIEFYSGIVKEYNSAQKNFLENQAVIDLGETLKTTNINSQEAFDGYIQGVKDSTEYSEAYKEVLIGLANSTFPEFSGAVQDSENKLSGLNSGFENASQSVTELSETITALNSLNEEIGKISTALNEFNQDGAVSIGTLSSMSDELKSLSYFGEFVSILNDSASTMEDVQDACNQLAKEYIDTTGILDDINESNAELIETQLEEIGVTNAHVIVQERLTAAKYESIIAEASFSDASENGAEALLKNAGASETVIAFLKQLRQEEYNARLATLDLTTATSANIESLIQQAKAAGVAAKSISALSTLKNLTERGYEYYAGSGLTQKGYDALLENARRAAQVDVSDLTNITLPEVTVSVPRGSSKGSSGGSTKKEVEEYIAEIDQFREATERLRKAQENRGNIESSIDNSDDLQERIILENELINAYKQEQSALHNLNDQRDATITSGVESLRKLGFAVQYNADTNELWISNMEHLNELAADSKGKYDTLQEATNALRKDTEDLIGTLTDLNEENRDGSSSWRDLQDSISEAKVSIINDLKDIVNEASDSLDEIQNVSDTLYAAADEFAANDGFITIDTYQSLLKLGPQYMQMLKDENGILQINEERINDVIAARTQQLAVENAMSYVERIKLATQEGSVENLDNLIFATTDATNSTWGLVYAELELMHTMGDLNDSQYQAALHNIEAMQDLANNAVANIGKATDAVAKNLEETRKQLEDTKDGLEDLLDELEDMEDGANDLVKYVMDMLKHRIQEQIDLLEEMKDKYSEIIDLKKDSLDATKDEQDYQKSIAKKLREMAKLQERINALSLDDSRSAQAERAKLLEEMAELQEDLADSQADKSIEAQKEALDQMEKDYHEEKDEEIKVLENSISSYQKLYDMAISYIRDNWDTLYQELISWNTEYGTVLNSEITEAWEAAQSAAQRYGDFVSAIMGGISSEIDSITQQIETLNNEISNLDTSTSVSAGSSGSGGSTNNGKNTTVGTVGEHTGPSNEEMIHSIIKRMYANMNEHGGSGSSTSAARKAELSQENLRLGAQLGQYGVSAYRSTDKEDLGTWYTDSTKREKLFDKYRRYIYHTGGVVGDAGTLKDDEVLATLKKGEWVLNDPMIKTVKRITAMMQAFADKTPSFVQPIFPEAIRNFGSSTVSNITNNMTDNRPVEIHMGDVIVNAQSNSAYVIADEVRKVTRDNANDLARMLKIKL